MLQVLEVLVLLSLLHVSLCIPIKGYQEALDASYLLKTSSLPQTPLAFSSDTSSVARQTSTGPLATPLRTNGASIVDKNGKTVKLSGLNWAGASDVSYVPCGLEKNSVQAIAQMFRNSGLNHVRLAYSNIMLRTNPAITLPATFAINTKKNPWFVPGITTAMQVFDKVVAALDAAGVGIILNNHNTGANYCCGGDPCEVQWQNAGISGCQWSQTTAQWTADWVTLVQRYSKFKMFIGADLRNDPRDGGGVTTSWEAWNAAATQAGNAILKANNNLLIIVNGVNYAGDLTGVKFLPVTLATANRVVYGYHAFYWWNGNARDCYGCIEYNEFKPAIELSMGYVTSLPKGAAAPVYVGEFGMAGFGYMTVSQKDVKFLENIGRYIQEKGLSWAVWTMCHNQPGNGYKEEGYTVTSCDYSTLHNDYRLPVFNAMR